MKQKQAEYYDSYHKDSPGHWQSIQYLSVLSLKKSYFLEDYCMLHSRCNKKAMYVYFSPSDHFVRIQQIFGNESVSFSESSVHKPSPRRVNSKLIKTRTRYNKTS